MIETIDTISQIVIVFTGLFSVYLMSSPKAINRRNGAAIGLFGEPFWFATAYIHDQAGVVVLAFVYGVNWARAFYINYKLVKQVAAMEAQIRQRSIDRKRDAWNFIMGDGR